MTIKRDVKYPGRWGSANADFPLGVPQNRTTATSADGSYLEKDWIGDYEAFFGALITDAGMTPSGNADTSQSSQLFDSSMRLRPVKPLNNDYNGYMDPDHQSSLPSDAGYPGNSGSPTAYAIDDEISIGIFSGGAGNSVSSDDTGWIFSVSIYKEFEMTVDQIALIDIDSVNVFVKDEAGQSHYWKNGDTGVTVSKPTSTTLRVTLDSAIFGVITKLWRFFVTEKVGYVGELNPDTVSKYFQVVSGSLDTNGYYITSDKVNGNPIIFQWGDPSVTSSNVETVSYPVPFPNAALVVIASDIQRSSLSTGSVSKPIVTYIKSNSQFEVVMHEATSVDAFSWFAIGY